MWCLIVSACVVDSILNWKHYPELIHIWVVQGIAWGTMLAHCALAEATLYSLRIPALNFYLTMSTDFVKSFHLYLLEVTRSISVIEKQKIILGNNTAIIHVQLWKIFYGWLHFSRTTSVDLSLNLEKFQHVKSHICWMEARKDRSYSMNLSFQFLFF